MNDLILARELERVQDLDREAPDEPHRYTLEVVVLYELVKVDAQ